MNKRPKIVVLGGGTGTFVVLSGLKDKPVDLVAVISMMDSGGSNRVLRDEFGLLPTSDIRQCLVALAEDKGDQEILRQLFTYRFHQGVGISGMTFGNLFMAALADIYKNQAKALNEVQRLLHTKGKILPVTLDDVQLVARYENGYQVIGEHAIDEPKHDGRLKIVEIETIPQANIFNEARKEILAADLIILGPGDLYTSLVPNLIVKGLPEAICKSKAKTVFILNLMTKYGQTYGFKASDFVEKVEKYLRVRDRPARFALRSMAGGDRVLDYVLVNNNWKIPKSILVRYEEEQAELIKDDLEKEKKLEVIRTDLLSPIEVKKVAGDSLKRSILRHDSQKLAREILKLLF